MVGLLLMHQIVASPFGYTLRMIRDNAERASYLGVEVVRVRLIAFVLAGVFASVGGMVMSLFVSGAYPDFAYWTISGDGMFIIMLGGINVFLGPMRGHRDPAAAQRHRDAAAPSMTASCSAW